jgi:hypothetical protein
MSSAIVIYRLILRCDGRLDKITESSIAHGQYLKKLMQKARRLCRNSWGSRDAALAKIKAEMMLPVDIRILKHGPGWE